MQMEGGGRGFLYWLPWQAATAGAAPLNHFGIWKGKAAAIHNPVLAILFVELRRWALLCS